MHSARFFAEEVSTDDNDSVNDEQQQQHSGPAVIHSSS